MGHGVWMTVLDCLVLDTFTNGNAIVQGNSNFDPTEIKVGDIVIDDNGDKVRVADIQPKNVATSAVNASNEQITITNHGFVANQEYTIKQMVELQSLV